MPYRTISSAATKEKFMILISEPAPIGQSDLAELYNLQLAAPRPTRRRTRRILLGFALAGVIAGLAFSQAPLQFMPLADGYSPEHNVNLHLKGQTDVLRSEERR